VVSRDAGRLSEAFGTEHLHIEADCSSVAGVQKVFEVAAARQLVPDALAHCVGNIRLGSVPAWPRRISTTACGPT
jgi:hypothetical protein